MTDMKINNVREDIMEVIGTKALNYDEGQVDDIIDKKQTKYWEMATDYQDALMVMLKDKTHYLNAIDAINEVYTGQGGVKLNHFLCDIAMVIAESKFLEKVEAEESMAAEPYDDEGGFFNGW